MLQSQVSISPSLADLHPLGYSALFQEMNASERCLSEISLPRFVCRDAHPLLYTASVHFLADKPTDLGGCVVREM